MKQSEKKAILYGRLGQMLERPGQKTRKAERPWVLSNDQIVEWLGFFEEVRDVSKRVVGYPEPQAALPPAPGHYVVATESGVLSFIVQHALEQVGKVLEAQGMRARYADRATGGFIQRGIYPDTSAQANITNGHRLVGEFKGPWNTSLQPGGRRLCVLGQVAKYSDEYGCRYGFACTHTEAIFVKRISQFRFAVSPIILGSDVADANTLSMRECFYFLGTRMDRADWEYHGAKGGTKLVDGTWSPARSLRSTQV